MPETLRSSAKLSLAVLVSRVLGLVREALFAALFGAGQLADAYYVAFRIPNLLRDLFAEGALSSAFVPTFTAELTDGGPARAHDLANLTLSGVAIVTGTLSVLGIVFAQEVVVAISGGFVGDAQKVALATRLTRIMMPILALVSLGAVWMGMLNAQRRYLAPAYAPAMFNLASIIVAVGLLVAGHRGADALLVWSLGTLGAGVIQAAMQLPGLWRSGYRPMIRLIGLWRHPGIRRILRLMAPAVLGLAAIQINVFVNTRFASALGDGPVGYLTYAFRLFYLPVGMFAVALATVTTTRVAEDAARGDRRALVARAAEGVSAAWMLTAASAVGLFVLAEPAISLVYQRGAFTSTDTAATAMVLRAYLLGLVPYSLVKILAPAFYSIDRPRIPLLASACAVLVNITFNAFTYRQLGAPGIALGTSLGALTNVAVLRLAFRRVVGPVRQPRPIREGVVLVVANAVMAGAVWGAWQGVSLLIASLGPGASVVSVVGLLLCVAGGFVIYVGVLRLGGYPGATLLWAMPGKLWRRFKRSKPESSADEEG